MAANSSSDGAVHPPSRVALLRRPRILAGAAGAVLAAHLLTFENCADLKFFGGISFAHDVYLAVRPPPPTLLRLPCAAMDRALDSNQPILFEGCIPDSVGIEDIGYFADERQNLFPPCEGRNVRRHFQFFDAENRSKDIIEQVPCNPNTLREKIETFAHVDIARDENYFEVHTRMLTDAEQARFDGDLRARVDVGALSVDRMTAPTMTHFLHAGRTAVYYLHSHMDRFLSFCLQEEKRWTLVAPQHHVHFASTWSGNAEMMLRELTPAPRLEIVQKRGDVLFVPPWWIHQTQVKPGTKNLGVNIHWMSRGQVLGYGANLFRVAMGDTAWFYKGLKL